MLLRIAMTRLASPADAEDVVQDVFLKLLTARPQFRDDEHEKAWLIRATLHRACDMARMAERRTLPLEDAEVLPEFKEAARALEENAYSGIVETDAGYHIILRRPIRQYVADQYLSELITVAMDNAEVTYGEAYDTLDVRQFQIDYQTYTALHSAVDALTGAQEETDGDGSDTQA